MQPSVPRACVLLFSLCATGLRFQVATFDATTLRDGMRVFAAHITLMMATDYMLVAAAELIAPRQIIHHRLCTGFPISDCTSIGRCWALFSHACSWPRCSCNHAVGLHTCLQICRGRELPFKLCAWQLGHIALAACLPRCARLL